MEKQVKKRDQSLKWKKWYKINKVKRKKDVKGYMVRLRISLLTLMGNKCIKCNFEDIRALQVDHINGGGCKEKKIMTRNYYKAVIESILKEEGKYQLLCANCNWIKRTENREVRK